MTDETFEDTTPEHPDATSPALPSRRVLLRSAALTGVAVPFLAACGGSSGGSTSGTSGGSSDSGGGTSAGSTNSGSSVLASTSEVPQGGGLILDDDGIVITQPEAGTFKGFSNICTHQQCPVDNVSNGTINCTCHGSMYSIEDGSVVGGPAPAPLPPKTVTVKGKNISLA